VGEWKRPSTLQRTWELLLAVYEEEDIIAIGGLTSDPYSGDPRSDGCATFTCGPMPDVEE